MLKLIKCEFLKLKRKKFIPLIILAAFLFPIPLTYLMTTPSMIERYTDRADAFDGLFNMVLGYGIQFLLPCIIGVIAAILFFMERDNVFLKHILDIFWQHKRSLMKIGRIIPGLDPARFPALHIQIR